MKKQQSVFTGKIWILVAAFVAILALSGALSLACYSPADAYAVEVVLNKPGVSYNLSKLAGVECVVAVSYFGSYAAYAYKSHYDYRLVVVVSKQGLKHANVQALGDEPVAVVSVKGLNVSLEQISNNIEKAGDELGWRVERVPLPPVPSSKSLGLVFVKTMGDAEVRVFLGTWESRDGGEGCAVELRLLIKGVGEVSEELASRIKLEIEGLLDKVGFSQLKGFLRLQLIKRALAEKPPEQERFVAVRVQIPLRQEVITTTVHSCSISYHSEGFNISELRVEGAKKLGWSVWVKKPPKGNYVGFAMVKSLENAKLYVEGKGQGGEIYLSLRVEGVSNLSDEVLNELRGALEATGLDGNLLEKCSFEKFEESRDSRFVPAYNISEEEVKEALRRELEWLLENGVISGLSGDDVEAIVSAAKLGYAGWNGRLVWFNGKWTSYSLTDGALVLRCVGMPPSFSFPEEELGKPSRESPETPSAVGSDSEPLGSSYEETLKAIIYLAMPIIVALLAGTIAYLAIRK